jgi:hypothetical protein
MDLWITVLCINVINLFRKSTKKIGNKIWQCMNYRVSVLSLKSCYMHSWVSLGWLFLFTYWCQIAEEISTANFMTVFLRTMILNRLKFKTGFKKFLKFFSSYKFIVLLPSLDLVLNLFLLCTVHNEYVNWFNIVFTSQNLTTHWRPVCSRSSFISLRLVRGQPRTASKLNQLLTVESGPKS